MHRHRKNSPRYVCTQHTERIVNVWNSLPVEIDFSTVKSFTRTIKRVSFNDFVSYS